MPQNLVANTYATANADAALGNVADTSVQGRLSLMPADRLPKSMLGDIFSKTQQESLLMTLGRQVPIGINETVVRVGDTFPEAGQVGNGSTLDDREGATKPVSGYKYGTEKSFRPIKLAVIVTVSEEFARQNIDGLYTELATQLPRSIARAADLAVFHNLDALRGYPLKGTTENGSINATTNRVELNFHKDADLVDQLLQGYRLVTGGDVYDFTNFAAMPSMRAEVVARRDANGNPVFVPGAFPGSGAEINVNANVGSLLGVPVTFNKLVGGKVGNVPTGTKVKMFGGDFSQLVWGYADEIRFKVTDSATVGGVSLWETNQIAVLCEATFGWYVNDPEAFVAYEDATADVAPA